MFSQLDTRRMHDMFQKPQIDIQAFKLKRARLLISRAHYWDKIRAKLNRESRVQKLNETCAGILFVNCV